MKLVLHVGFGKCASSSLQATLSHSPVIRIGDNTTLYYGVIKRKRIFYGDAIHGATDSSVFGYCASDHLLKLKNHLRAIRNKIAKLSELLGDNSVLLLSCEAWHNHPQLIREMIPVELLAGNVEILCIVRAPVSWINSAYWQWGAWTSLTQSQWIRQVGLKRVDWNKHLNSIKAILPEVPLRVFPITSSADVIRLIFTALNFDASTLNDTLILRSNTSLPLEILHLFVRYPELRDGPHSSGIDFLISKIISPKTSGILNTQPFSLSKDEISDLIESTAYSCHQLAENHLTASARDAIQADAQWTCADYYSKFNYVSREQLENRSLCDSVALECILADALVFIRAAAKNSSAYSR